jgi:hypothetical protein
MGDLNVKVGCDSQEMEPVMGTHGVGEASENGNWLWSSVHQMIWLLEAHYFLTKYVVVHLDISRLTKRESD